MFLFWENEDEKSSNPDGNMFMLPSPKSISFESIFKAHESAEAFEFEKAPQEITQTEVLCKAVSEDLSDSINKKREGARIRSKRTRERKKQYIQELELRVKCLEKENVKLQNELERYKSDKKDEESK